MGWLALVVLIVAGFAIPRLGRVLRIVAAVGLAVGALGASAWYLHDRYNSSRNRRAQIAARNVIPVRSVELLDLRLDTWTQASTVLRLAARVTNNSPDTLEGVGLSVSIRDCPDLSAYRPGAANYPEGNPFDCKVIAADDSVVLGQYNEGVPSGQTRDLEAYVHIPIGTVPHGKMQWGYTVLYTVKRWHRY